MQTSRRQLGRRHNVKPVAQLKQNTETVSASLAYFSTHDVNEAETNLKLFQCFVSGMCGLRTSETRSQAVARI